MADDLGDTIRTNAQGPAKASGDSGSMEQHKLPEQIEADRYLNSKQAAQRKGAIVSVHGLNKGETDIPLERLLIEHALSVNTAAAGGNASLMTIG